MKFVMKFRKWLKNLFSEDSFPSETVVLGRKKSKKKVYIFGSEDENDMRGLLRDIVSRDRERSLTEFRNATEYFVPREDEDIDLLLSILHHPEWRYANIAAGILCRSNSRTAEILSALSAAGGRNEIIESTVKRFYGKKPAEREPVSGTSVRTPDEWEKYGIELERGYYRYLGLHDFKLEPPNPASAAECYAIAFRDDYPRARERLIPLISLLRERYLNEVLTTLQKHEQFTKAEFEQLLVESVEHVKDLKIRPEAPLW